ncbi:unnamed protein product [Staurois parvus]|uniref:Uncharacterized protein n=1 Tax=Staurois parvus TaxID=386267 RepID=A0ABN9GXT6_9NEOB|nr:unnamed protein product [Staurois parvus]
MTHITYEARGCSSKLLKIASTNICETMVRSRGGLTTHGAPGE